MTIHRDDTQTRSKHIEPSPYSKPAPRRRIVGVLLLWVTISMLSASGLLMLQPRVGLDMGLLSLVMFAPAIGAAVCWLVFRSDAFRSSPRVGNSMFAMSLALSVLAGALYFVAISVARGNPPNIPGEISGAPVLVMIALQTLGSFGEEVGFRGLLFDSLKAWLSRPLAAIPVGVLFGLWHVQYYGLPLFDFLAFIAGAIALTLTMVSVMSGSFWQRMASCTIIHTGANLALAFVGTDQVAMKTFGAAGIIAAIVVIPLALMNERRSSRGKHSAAGT